MAWARFDDMFPWSRKVRRMSDAAFRLHVSGIVACARDLTDGVLTQDDLDDLPPMRGLPKRLEELVKSDAWHVKGHRCHGCVQPPAGGWVIHDYLDYNPTKADVEAEKAAARERQRRRRLARAGVTDGPDVTPDVTRDVHRESQGVSQTPPLPDPSPPVPTRPDPDVSAQVSGGGHQSDARADAPPPQRCGEAHPSAQACSRCGDLRKADKQAETERVKAEKAAAREAELERSRRAIHGDDDTPPDDGSGLSKSLAAVKAAKEEKL